MRTKTLLVTAAVSMVGIATSLAQVYSVNAVGYVNITVPCTPDASKGAVIANPLIGTNNELNTIMPLPADGSYDGTLIYRFTGTGYSDAISFYSFLGGWTPNATIAPGEAFWIFAAGATPNLAITFVGDVPQGPDSNGTVPAAGGYGMKSSKVPQTARIGEETIAGTLKFPAEDGDIIYVYDAANQRWRDSFTYYSFLGGWTTADPEQDPNGPMIPVATGFFLQKADTATKTAWTRDFSVN